MENNYSIKQWIEKFDNGDFNNKDRNVQIEAGWYDWFCDDSELRDRLYNMATIVKQLIRSPKLDLENMNVSFKNNCPIAFPLYDEIRFSEGMGINDVKYWIDINSGFQKSVFAVFEIKHALDTGFQESIFECNTMNELIEWFNYKIVGGRCL